MSRADRESLATYEDLRTPSGQMKTRAKPEFPTLHIDATGGTPDAPHLVQGPSDREWVHAFDNRVYPSAAVTTTLFTNQDPSRRLEKRGTAAEVSNPQRDLPRAGSTRAAAPAAEPLDLTTKRAKIVRWWESSAP
jgi:hypothetical protein